MRYLSAFVICFAMPLFAFPEEIPVKDLALQPLEIVSPPPERFLDYSKIIYQTGPSITISKGGRLWVSIMTGGRGEDNDNYVDLITSGDGGETWSKPLFALDIPGPVRTFDPAMWTDPTGKVWWYWCQIYDHWDGRGGLWAMTCDDPDRADAPWSPPRRLCNGVMKNKPIVTSRGEWWMCVEQWRIWDHLKPHMDKEWFHKDTENTGANIYRSTDQGETWHYLSTIFVPEEVDSCNEHMAVELKDGSFRMLLRTQYGIGESKSTDHGRTWTETVPSEFKNPESRFFFARLASGNIILIKNGPLDSVVKDKGRWYREKITAYLSEDDGKTFPYSLMLDPRGHVSYPDACQDTDGLIYAIHDFERTGKWEIILDRFTEEDIKAGKIVSKKGKLGTIVRKNAPK